MPYLNISSLEQIRRSRRARLYGMDYLVCLGCAEVLFGVCGGAEEILVSIRGFDIEICREGIIVIDGNSDVKKMYGLLGLFCGEFDSGMGVVGCIDEVGVFVLSVCPNH